MRGILLTNLGTPATCKKEDVQQFICDMLSDPLLTDLPEWLSKFLAKNIIAPLSSSKSQKKYSLIWRKEEPQISPLLYHMQKLAEKLESRTGLPVEIAMRYGEPDIQHAFNALEKKCPLLHELIIFPMYPQYAQSTIQTATDEIGRVFYQHPHSFRLKFIRPYYNHQAYIHALAANAKAHLNDEFDKLVFCYHSLPMKQVEKGQKKGREFDYVFQLKETNRLLANELNIPYTKQLLFFSSQRGNGWLKPFLSKDIESLPQQGYQHIAIIAPGFTVDNMETLYDIDIEARELFMEAGGKAFSFIPSLNNSDEWIEAIWKIIGSN
jgi:ferrochelatase